MGASNQSNQEVQGSVQSSLGATIRQYFLLKQDRKPDDYKSISSNKLTRVSRKKKKPMLTNAARVEYCATINEWEAK